MLVLVYICFVIYTSLVQELKRLQKECHYFVLLRNFSKENNTQLTLCSWLHHFLKNKSCIECVYGAVCDQHLVAKNLSNQLYKSLSIVITILRTTRHILSIPDSFHGFARGTMGILNDFCRTQKFKSLL